MRKYVVEPVDRYGIIYRVGFYRPNTNEWVEAPRVEGWADHGGLLRGPLLGYTKDLALTYLNWLNGGNSSRSFSFDY